MTALSGRREECLVCREQRGEVDLPGGQLDDGPVVTFHRPPGEATTVYAGHLLVTPRRHVADFAGLSAEEAGAVGVAISKHSRGLEDLGATRVYVATIGHGVDHLHVHLLPRWPHTPDEVPWHSVDEWPGARRIAAAEVADLVRRLRR